MAVDVINFMDALKIDKAILAGFDWAHEALISLWRFGLNAAKAWFLSVDI